MYTGLFFHDDRIEVFTRKDDDEINFVSTLRILGFIGYFSLFFSTVFTYMSSVQWDRNLCRSPAWPSRWRRSDALSWTLDQ